MKAPHTYTKEDVVEINCHGGIISAKKFLKPYCNMIVDWLKGENLQKEHF